MIKNLHWFGLKEWAALVWVIACVILWVAVKTLKTICWWTIMPILCNILLLINKFKRTVGETLWING